MHNFTSAGPSEEGIPSSDFKSFRSVDEALEEIDRILRQMLLLAELSAGDGSVDRESLQKVLERLQKKIDRIADGI